MRIYQYVVLLSLMMSACIPFPLQKYPQPLEKKKNVVLAQKQAPTTSNEMKLREIEMVSFGNPVRKTIRVVNYIQPSLWYSEKIYISPIRSESFNGAKPKQETRKYPKIVWNSALFPQDFSYIEKLCQQFNLLKQSDIKMPKAVKPFKRCDNNSHEVKIYLRFQTGQENSFIIASDALCASQYIPQGVKRVMGELDALISKYQPSPDTQVVLLGVQTL